MFVYWGSAGLFSPIQRHIHIHKSDYNHIERVTYHNQYYSINGMSVFLWCAQLLHFATVLPSLNWQLFLSTKWYLQKISLQTRQLQKMMNQIFSNLNTTNNFKYSGTYNWIIKPQDSMFLVWLFFNMLHRIYNPNIIPYSLLHKKHDVYFRKKSVYIQHEISIYTPSTLCAQYSNQHLRIINEARQRFDWKPN
jgi:hypothetical protein